MNPKLIQWDYGKEINITLEDALMSLESLRFMLGGAIKQSKTGAPVIVRHTEEVVCDSQGRIPKPKDRFGMVYTPKAWKDHPIRLINLTTGARTQLTSDDTYKESAVALAGENPVIFKNASMLGDTTVVTKFNDHIRIFWEEEIVDETDTAVEVTISPDTFPGTYRVVGDTFMRSEKTGKDEPFQFVINKAKVQSNVTITLQAEGDPSTFEMTLNVLRSTNDEGENEMMKLVRYSVGSSSETSSGNDIGSLGEAGSGGG